MSGCFEILRDRLLDRKLKLNLTCIEQLIFTVNLVVMNSN